MAIAYENSVGQTGEFLSSISVALDSGSNPDICVLVFALTDRGGATTINSATYGGVAMTAHTAFTSVTTSFDGRLFYLGNAPSGSNTVQVTYSDGNMKPKFLACAYSGVDGSTPVDQLANVTVSNANVSSTVTSTTGDLVLLLGAQNGRTAVVPSSPAVERFDALLGNGTFYGFLWEEAGASSVTIDGSATGGSTEWWCTALNLKAAGGAASFPKTNRMLMGIG